MVSTYHEPWKRKCRFTFLLGWQECGQQVKARTIARVGEFALFAS